MFEIPETAIVIPKENPYVAVNETEDKLELYLLNADNFKVSLDKKILADLVDTLIEMQNR